MSGKTFFGFAFSASMLPAGEVNMTKTDLTAEQAKNIVTNGVISCCNPSHKSTTDAMTKKFDITVDIPEKPPRVALDHGDSIVILQVSGLPRLTDRHEYNDAEIASAKFDFVRIEVK